QGAAAGRHPGAGRAVPQHLAQQHPHQPDGVPAPDRDPRRGRRPAPGRGPLRLPARRRPARRPGRRRRTGRAGARLPAHQPAGHARRPGRAATGRAAGAGGGRGHRALMATPVPPLAYAFARRHGVLLLGEDADGPRVGLREDGDAQALAEVRRALGRPLRVQVLERAAFDRRLSEVYADAGLGDAARSGGLELPGTLDSLLEDIPATADLLDSRGDAPVIRLINGLIAEAVRLGASDVHIESFESALRVRFRVDGVMREALNLPARIAPLLVSRVKVMARLDIAERRVPQDGRVSLAMGSRQLDVRVSTLPTRGGERVVLRILDKDQGGLSLQELGFSPPALAALQRALQTPNGIVLVTGPTGSGKTTTLY